LMPARPRDHPALLAADAPAPGQGGRELGGHLVGKEDAKGPEVAGACQEKRQGAFFLPRSRAEARGSA
jgi:hypothetical protein